MTDKDKLDLLNGSIAITVDQLAEVLAVGRNAAYEAVRRGDIDSIRIGKLIRIPTSSLRQKLGL